MNNYPFAAAVNAGVVEAAYDLPGLNLVGQDFTELNARFIASVAGAVPGITLQHLADPRVDARLREIAREEARREIAANPVHVTPVIDPRAFKVTPVVEHVVRKVFRPAAFVLGLILGLVGGFFLWRTIDPGAVNLTGGDATQTVLSTGVNLPWYAIGIILAIGMLAAAMASLLFPRKVLESKIVDFKFELNAPHTYIPTTPATNGKSIAQITQGA